LWFCGQSNIDFGLTTFIMMRLGLKLLIITMMLTMMMLMMMALLSVHKAMTVKQNNRESETGEDIHKVTSSLAPRTSGSAVQIHGITHMRVCMCVCICVCVYVRERLMHFKWQTRHSLLNKQV